MSQSVDTVFIISPVDFEKVQRHTERYYLAKYCSENHDTHVITPSSRIPDVSNHNFYFEGILGVLTLNLLFLPMWAKLFIQNKPDVIHCYPEVIFPQYIAQLVIDSEVVFDIRADPFEQQEEFNSKMNRDTSLIKRFLNTINRLLFQWAVVRADVVVTLSDDLSRKLCQNYGIDYEQIHLVPQGVDTNKFNPPEKRDDSKLGIVYLGTINGLRGLNTFFDAMHQLDPQVRSKIHIDLIGGGDKQFISDVLSTANDSMPELTVNYHGYVDHEKIPEIAGRNHLAISPLPGLESYNVSSPAKVYEYLALGLPVLATDIPAHRRILTDTEDSIFVSPESPDEIAAAIKTLIEDRAKIIQMGRKARENAIQHSWDNRFSSLFERVSQS